jgi:hypothetical protein
MLESGRNTLEVKGEYIILPVKANTEIHEGALVMIDAGYAIPAKKGTGLIVGGRAEEYVDNTGAGGSNGAKSIRVKRGVFLLENDTTNPVGIEHVLKDCYAFDDDTVTSLETDASKAGKILGFSGSQVIVDTTN